MAAVMAVAMENTGEQLEEDMEDVMGDALSVKQKNTLPVYGNKETMNINPMILSNIQGSAYFKEELYKMKTFHEVIDEIFYKVSGLCCQSSSSEPPTRSVGGTPGAVGEGQQKACRTSRNVWRGKCGSIQ